MTSALITMLCASLAAAAADEHSVPLGKAQRLHIHSAGGDVAVRAERGKRVRVQQKKTLGGPGCQAKVHVKAGVVHVDSGDPSGAPCGLDINVFAPPQLAVTVEQEEGNLRLSGTRGALVLRLNHGNAVVGGLFPSMSAELGHGSISVQGLQGDGTLTLNGGNAQVYYAQNSRGTLQLNVNGGNVTLIVGGASVSIAADVASQDHITNPVPPAGADTADITVAGQLNAGRLYVRGIRH